MCSASYRKGASLTIVLAVVVIVANLVAGTWVIWAMNNAQAHLQQRGSEGRLGMLSATDYATWKANDDSLPWRPVDLRHGAPEPALEYFSRATQTGAFGWVMLSASLRKGAIPITDSSWFRLVRDNRNWPALTILDTSAGISLAGNARILGNVAVHRGTCSRSTTYNMMAGARALHDGLILDSSSHLWDSIAFDPRPVKKWLQDVARIPETKVATLLTVDRWSAEPGQTLRHLGKVRISGTLAITKATIVAEEIEVEENVSIQNSILCARKITLRGKGQFDGQFIALDTLEVDATESQTGAAFFWLQGREVNSVFTGLLWLKAWKGKASAVVAAEGWNQVSSEIASVIEKKVVFQGDIFSNATMEILGQVNGHVIAHNIATRHNGTLWIGFLRDAVITDTAQAGGMLPDLVHAGHRTLLQREIP